MGLQDIAPPEVMAKKFEIRGGSIEVHGVKTKDWVALQRRFPELRIGLNGEKPDENTIITAVEGLVPAVIAAGLGVLGDPESEALIVDRLTDGEQMMIFGVIMEFTAPESKANQGPLLESPPRDGQTMNGIVEPPMMNSQQLSML